MRSVEVFNWKDIWAGRYVALPLQTIEYRSGYHYAAGQTSGPQSSKLFTMAFQEIEQETAEICKRQFRADVESNSPSRSRSFRPRL